MRDGLGCVAKQGRYRARRARVVAQEMEHIHLSL